MVIVYCMLRQEYTEQVYVKGVLNTKFVNVVYHLALIYHIYYILEIPPASSMSIMIAAGDVIVSVCELQMTQLL